VISPICGKEEEEEGFAFGLGFNALEKGEA
jgi:hypothetical protein